MRILDVQSSKQRIELYRELESGLVLVMDGMGQFYESIEYRYHECLAVVPMLFANVKNVFVGGGGDGLAATRLLRFETVEKIVVCDYDGAITELATKQKDLVTLNEGSLSDSRVVVVNDDAFSYLEQNDSTYDLIICDFPDPLFAELNRLYSVEFYKLAHRRLTEAGVLVTQTRHEPACVRIVGATVERVFACRKFFRFTEHGFTIASKQPLERKHPVPSWTRYLNEASIDALFALAKDEEGWFDVAGENVNRADSNTLVKETVLAEYGRWVVTPFLYRDELFLVELTCEVVDRLGGGLQLLIEGLHENGRLVILADVLFEQRGQVLADCGYQPTGRTCGQIVCSLTDQMATRAHQLRSETEERAFVEEKCARLEDDDELKTAVFENVSRLSDLFVGVPEAVCSLNTDGTYLLIRDDTSHLVALYSLSRATDGVAVERLTAIDDVNAAMHVVEHLWASGNQTVTFRQPGEAEKAVLEELTGRPSVELEVYLHPRETCRESPR